MSVGHRTMLAVPLLREGVAIGAIHHSPNRSSSVYRQANRSSQNLRRSSGHRHRERAAVQRDSRAQRRIARGPEHQTATAEVLGIISRSPTDVQPVLDAIVESAARVCGIDDVVLRLREGNVMVSRAHFGSIPMPSRVEISMDEPQFRWMREHGTLHVPDVRAQNDFPTSGPSAAGAPFLAVPLRQQGELIGATDRTSHRGAPLHPGADQAP